MFLDLARGRWLWHTLVPAVAYGDFSTDRGSQLATGMGWNMKISGLCALLSVFIHLLPSAGSAQTLHATIRGQAADISGSSLAGVQVTAVNEDTGEKRRTLSSPDGEFTLSVLPAGSYRLEAELPGFRKYVGRGISLQVGQDLRVNLALQRAGRPRRS